MASGRQYQDEVTLRIHSRQARAIEPLEAFSPNQ